MEKQEEKQRKKKRRLLTLLTLLAFLLLAGGVFLYLGRAFTVTFDTRNGEKLPNMNVTRTTVDLPIPVQPGQTFLGWTTSATILPNGKNNITSTKQLSSSVTLYAHWEETQYFTSFFSEGEPVLLLNGQHSQLGYGEKDGFTHELMNGLYKAYWNLTPAPGSGHAAFQGWTFKDLNGYDAYLWINGPDRSSIEPGLDSLKNPYYYKNTWTLESYNESVKEYTFSLLDERAEKFIKPFQPALYDGALNAVWEYRKVDIHIIQNQTGIGGYEASEFYGKTVDFTKWADQGNPNLWYTGGGALVGWKIAFREYQGSQNESPLKYLSDGIVGRDQMKDCKLNASELQKINDLLDRTYSVFEPFELDPLLAYLTFQETGVLHKLYLYPAVFEDSESRFLDARFNKITESGPISRREDEHVVLGKPQDRDLERFVRYEWDLYDLTGVNPVRLPNSIENGGRAGQLTLQQIEAGSTKRYVPVKVGAASPEPYIQSAAIHPFWATVFYEVWESKDITLTFNYGPEGIQSKGYYNNGVRRIHDISYNADDKPDNAIKTRHKDGMPSQLKRKGTGKTVYTWDDSKVAGKTIFLPSASMFIRPNMSFIGWQEETLPSEKPGRIYPAGSEYTVSSTLGTSYTLNAVWSDSTICFAFNLAGGREFVPSDINVMRGRPGEIVKVPTEKPTRIGYDFDGWKSNKTDNGKDAYAPGENIKVLDAKQILTAQWKAKQVTLTLDLTFVYTAEYGVAGFDEGVDYEINGKIERSDLVFDQTTRLQAITSTSNLTNVTVRRFNQTSARPATSIEIAKIKADSGDDQWFNSFYRLVGWTFRDPANVLDRYAVTFTPTQTINLNERIVRETQTPGGIAMHASAFQKDEKNTVDLVVYDNEGHEIIRSLNPLINSFPRLSRSDYAFEAAKVWEGKAHEFMGFFAVPQAIVNDLGGFSGVKDKFWDNTKGTFTSGTHNVDGKDRLAQRLQFYPTGTSEGEVAGIVGQGNPGNYLITSSTNFYLWLEPKEVTIEYYGINSQGQPGDAAAHTVKSYFGDKREEKQNLGFSVGAESNILKIPQSPDFIFLEWRVEYYTDGAHDPFETQIVDLQLNTAGTQALANPATLELWTDKTKNSLSTNAIEAPVRTIKVKPVMQSINEFVVRVIDPDGSLTGTAGMRFNVKIAKENPVDILVDAGDNVLPPGTPSYAKRYIGGEVKLEKDDILNATIAWYNPAWGMARWPQVPYADSNIYGDEFWREMSHGNLIYVGPGSDENRKVTLFDLLDYRSKTITGFRIVNENGSLVSGTITPPWYDSGLDNKIELYHSGSGSPVHTVTPALKVDVRTGSVTLRPELANVAYTVKIMNGDDELLEIPLATGGMPIVANGAPVMLSDFATINSQAQQLGYYFLEGKANLSTLNYLDPDIRKNLQRDEIENLGMFRIGNSYSVGNGSNQIPPGARNIDGVIKLYIVWLPCNVTIRYENTGEGPAYALKWTDNEVDYLVGGRVSLLGKQADWFYKGYEFAGWSIHENGSTPRFEFHNDAGSQQVLLAANPLLTNGGTPGVSGSGTLGVGAADPLDTHTSLTIRLYPYWKPTTTGNVTFHLEPHDGYPVPNIKVWAGATSRFELVGPQNNWSKQDSVTYKMTNVPFSFGDDITNLEADWRNFHCEEVDAFGMPVNPGADMLYFGGWYYVDKGVKVPLTVVNGRLAINDEMFLENVGGNQFRIKQTIDIYASWVPDVSELVQFDVSKEAVKREYQVTDIADGATQIFVSVRNGYSGDAEFASLSGQDADNVPYTLKHNLYDGPAGKEGIKIVVGAQVYNSVTYPYYDMYYYPHFYRTEVAVSIIGIDGQPQKIVKTLNTMYEKLPGAITWDTAAVGRPDDRVTVTTSSMLVRYEIVTIDTKSASQMVGTAWGDTLRNRTNDRLAKYTSFLLPNYAMFNGRQGVPNSSGTGLAINNIYGTFVKGQANSEVPYDGLDCQFTRFGYELIGFAISDEYMSGNTGVAFGLNSGALNNTYINMYMTSPKPEPVKLVPIYKQRQVTLEFGFDDGLFGGLTELRSYTDLKFAGQVMPAGTTTVGTTTITNNISSLDRFTLVTLFDEVIDLPHLDVRGSKNPLLDKREWHAAWRYSGIVGGSTASIYATFGIMPSSYGYSSYNTSNALGFRVAQDPAAALKMEVEWGNSTRMEINFHVLVPQVGVKMDQWSSVPLSADPAAVNAIGGAGSYAAYQAAFLESGRFNPGLAEGSVAEHYRKPAMQSSGEYNYNLATYTVPMLGGVEDSAFNVTFDKTGLRLLGWFLGHRNETYSQIIEYSAATGHYYPKSEFKLANGALDKIWKQESGVWSLEPVTLDPTTPITPTERQPIRIYLIYDYVEGQVVFNENSTKATLIPEKTVFGKYGFQVQLPISSDLSKVSGETRDFYGWSKNALQRMRSNVQTVADLLDLSVSTWDQYDFVKVEDGPTGPGIPALFTRDEIAQYKLTPATPPTPVVIYSDDTGVGRQPSNPYKYDGPHGGKVDLYAVWVERLIIHEFRDGGTIIWNTLFGNSHNSAYGLEQDSVRFKNGADSEVKYFFKNIYGEAGGANSKLPVPTKEGYKFDCWKDQYGTVYGTGSVCEFSNNAVLYANWIPYHYLIEFDTNNIVPDQPTSVWVNPDAAMATVNSGNPDVTLLGGKTYTKYLDGKVLLPAYSTTQFEWSDSSENREFIGWTLKPNDSSAFAIDTRLGSKSLGFATADAPPAAPRSGYDHDVKVGIVNGSPTQLEYAGNPALVGGMWVRTVKLYALWSSGEMQARYFDDSTLVHAQDGYMLNNTRTDIGHEGRLVMPSHGTDDYMQYGVMIADESVLGQSVIDSKFLAGESFVGWRVTSPQEQLNKMYYPGDFLDGEVDIRSNVNLVAVWRPWHTGWNTLRTSGAVTDGVLVIPGSGSGISGVNHWNTNTLEVTNPNVTTIVFPRMTGGTIGTNRVIAHSAVTQIVLPSYGALTVSPQAIHSGTLKQLYLGNNLTITLNPVAGEAKVNQSTGAIEIKSAMTAYLIQQGAQRFIPDSGSGAQMIFATSTGGPYSDNPSDPNYLRGGNKNARSTLQFAYSAVNKNWFGSLYSTDYQTLFAYPGAAASITIHASVNRVKSYAYAYMSNILPTQAVLAVTPSNPITHVESNAIFHTNARVIRLPAVTGSTIAVDAVSGYQPEFHQTYFNTTDVTVGNKSSTYANFNGGILYHGSTQSSIMYVSRAVTHTSGRVAIANTVTTMDNNYALSSFYLGNPTEITHLSIDARVALNLAHFQNPAEARGQQAFKLTQFTFGTGAGFTLASVDHRIFSQLNNLVQINLSNTSANTVALTNFQTTDVNSCPIFVSSGRFSSYAGTDWGQIKAPAPSGNSRLQLVTKSVVYNNGGGGAGGSGPTSPLSIDYGDVFTVPTNTFEPPPGATFIGWRVTSSNSTIDGMIYQPGWAFNFGMTNGNVSLNGNVPGGSGANMGIYVQSSIILTAEWETKKLQFFDFSIGHPVRVDSQKVLVEESGGEYREATQMELAGKKVDTDGKVVNAFGELKFVFIGADQTTGFPSFGIGDIYSFVGWRPREDVNNPYWPWFHSWNESTRLIPDGTAFTYITSSEVSYYHALYDIATDNITYTILADTKTVSAKAKHGAGGDISIPAAVIGTSLGLSPSDLRSYFMKTVTEIPANAFADSDAERLTIGDKVKSIGDYAFWGSGDITWGSLHLSPEVAGIPSDGIILPARLESVGVRAFELTNITEFKISDSETNSSAAKYYVIDGNLCYTDGTIDTLIQYAPGKTATVFDMTVSEYSAITHIAAGAFAHNTALKEILIPASVTNIAEGAFEYSWTLEKITLGHAMPSGIHGGSAPLWNPFINTTAVIWVNAASHGELDAWNNAGAYQSDITSGPPRVFVSTNAPSAPSNLKAVVGNESGLVVLTWDVPGYQGSAVDGYFVRRDNADDGASWNSVISCGSSVFTHTYSGLANGTYTLEIYANAGGLSGVSASATFTLACSSEPLNFVIGTASASPDSSNTNWYWVDLSWTAPGNLYGQSVLYYEVRYRDTGGGSWTDDWTNMGLVYDNPTSKYVGTVKIPPTNGMYEFQIRAINASGQPGAVGTASSTISL